MTLLGCAFLLWIMGAFLSLICREERAKKLLALGGVVVGSFLCLIPAIQILAGKSNLSSSFDGTIPGFTFRIGLDPLGAFFLIPILGLSALVAIYAWGYLKEEKHLLRTLAFFPLLVASMAAVVIAQDGFLFLIVWEIMSLVSFFLVTAEHEKREVRNAGWLYLAATHVATFFLMVFFILLYKETGSFAFRDFVWLNSAPLTGFLFVCALIGFGTKAGIFPFHIWLPHAHPAAPSYISALMSGAMIKTGIYGIFRALTFFPTPPLWCAELLILFGIASAVLGVLYALTQQDIKKLLAYSSVENMGIILIGIGLGVVGRLKQQPIIELLGFGGALFHVLNHTLFKGLLFLGAGNIIHATHVRRIDLLGGLLKTMPFSGVTFLIASAAICGLPLLNGFISEWLIYIGLFEGTKSFSQAPFFFCIAALVGLALSGGLAVACFTKVFGVAFLGFPRTQQPRPLRESTWQQCLPIGVLALLCVVLGIVPYPLFRMIMAVVSDLGFAVSLSSIQPYFATVGMLNLIFAFPLVFFLILWTVRSLLMSGKPMRTQPTWACGFDSFSPKMQYTASSYAEPISTFFHFLLKPARHFKTLTGAFPEKMVFASFLEDLSERLMVFPLVQKTDTLLSWIRKRQRNRIQDYLAYIFAALLILLLWEVWIGI